MLLFTYSSVEATDAEVPPFRVPTVLTRVPAAVFLRLLSSSLLLGLQSGDSAPSSLTGSCRPPEGAPSADKTLRAATPEAATLRGGPWPLKPCIFRQPTQQADEEVWGFLRVMSSRSPSMSSHFPSLTLAAGPIVSAALKLLATTVSEALIASPILPEHDPRKGLCGSRGAAPLLGLQRQLELLLFAVLFLVLLLVLLLRLFLLLQILASPEHTRPPYMPPGL